MRNTKRNGNDSRAWIETALGTKQVARALDLTERRTLQLVAEGRLAATQTIIGHLYDPDDVARLAAERQRKLRAAAARPE